MKTTMTVDRESSAMNWLSHTDPIALFLDLDGTLIDIAATPASVDVPGGLPDLLVGLRRALGGALAIVSGRRIVDIDRLLSPAKFVTAGLHGAEYRTSPHEVVRPTAPPLPEAFVGALLGLGHRFPGVRVEWKGPSVSIHWRDAPEAAADLSEALRGLLVDAPDHLVMTGGRCVFEIGPKHVSKGAAVEILSGLDVFAGRRPIMIGDDVSDESAFATAERLGGAGFRVAGETFAIDDADFSSPRRVREWLSLVLAGAER